MNIIIWAFAILVLSVIVWFRCPFSPLKQDFQKDLNQLRSNQHDFLSSEYFCESEFQGFPIAIQQYLKHCGYFHTKKQSVLHMIFSDAKLWQNKQKKPLKLVMNQYNFVYEPSRIVFMKSQQYGIPFEGYDSYQTGIGRMKGVLAKTKTLFDETGEEMNRACLVTYLAECLLMPASLLQPYLTFVELSAYDVKATISYGGQVASGMFHFNEQYEMTSFTTQDRVMVTFDGKRAYIPWSARCMGYQQHEDGIKRPTRLQAIWHEAEGDFLYFDGEITAIKKDPHTS